jgi:hypothetical protein
MAGTSYNGVSGNVAPPTAVTITSSTNATPIVVLTASPHAMKTGDVVQIDGHLSNTNANGQWPVVVVDTTHFSLTGSTTTGAGGTAGTATPLVFTGNVSLNPVNGDPYDASTYIPGMSCLADRTAHLGTKVPFWKTVTKFASGISPGDFTDAGSSPALTAGTWGDWTGSVAAVSPFLQQLGASTLSVNSGDVARVRVVGTLRLLPTALSTLNGEWAAGIWYANWVPGAAETFVRGSAGSTQACSLDCSNQTPAPLTADFPISLAADISIGTTGFFDFKIRVLSSQNLTSTNLRLRGELGITYELLRPTGWPQ